MWKCKRCRKEVVEKETKYYFLDKNEEHEEIYEENYQYECTSCSSIGRYLSDIAEWED